MIAFLRLVVTMMKADRGFTLIELAVVLAIIGALAGTALAPLRIQLELLAGLDTTHDADHAPYQVIVNGGVLPRSPYEADDREPLQRITVQQVLLVSIRIRFREIVRQPVVVAHQLGEEVGAFIEDGGFVTLRPVEQVGEALDEGSESSDVVHGGGVPRVGGGG